MPTLRWKKGEFKITAPLVSEAVFDEWLENEGRIVWRQERRWLKARWFYGWSRARRPLLRDVRTLFRPGGAIANSVKRRLDRLPFVIRTIGDFIIQRGHKDLYSLDESRALVVVPRALVENELTNYLITELVNLPPFVGFHGLPPRVFREVAGEAEQLFFDHFENGRQFVDDSGRGVIMGVDPEFEWQLSRLDGHYYYGYPQGGTNLNRRQERSDFVSEMKEVLFGQSVYLNRLEPEEVATIADGFRRK